jgi:hypothetical protein
MAVVDGKMRCPQCGETKPLDAFAPALVRRGYGECRVCKNARNREYESRNRDKVAIRVRAWNERNRDKVRARGLASYYRHHDERKAQARASYERPEAKLAKHSAHVARRFGLSGIEYDAMLCTQGGGCAICRRPPKGSRRLAVDHDHETGRIRGLLCTLCNTALGRLGDTAASIESVLSYVKGTQQASTPAAPALRINLPGAN